MSLASVPVLSFAQFSMAVWLLTHYELATLSFNMFDVDGSGNLDIDEVKKIVSKVYSNSSPAHGGAMVAADGHTAQVGTPVDERAMQILEGMDVDGNGDVSKAEYCAMVKKYHCTCARTRERCCVANPPPVQTCSCRPSFYRRRCATRSSGTTLTGRRSSWSARR
jgi:hypothetical protein